MIVVNARPHTVSVPALGLSVKGNAAVEVADADAERLLSQPANWQPGHPCNHCDFVARTPGGKTTHERTHTQEDEQ